MDKLTSKEIEDDNLFMEFVYRQLAEALQPVFDEMYREVSDEFINGTGDKSKEPKGIINGTDNRS